MDGASGGGGRTRVKYAYQRPIFLQLFTEDEIQVTADHSVRPIIVPRDIGILPWFSGYAEAINAGKSARNEDQVQQPLFWDTLFFVVLFLIMMKTTGLPLTTTKEEYQQQQPAADVREKKLRYGFFLYVCMALLV